VTGGSEGTRHDLRKRRNVLLTRDLGPRDYGFPGHTIQCRAIGPEVIISTAQTTQKRRWTGEVIPKKGYPRSWTKHIWKNEVLHDPVLADLNEMNEDPDLAKILGLFRRTTGDPAFDQRVIDGNIQRLETTPAIDTGHAHLDLCVKTGLAFIDATFQGDHPKYGVKGYGANAHDGFPPTIIAAIDALSAWGMCVRAKQLFRYWLGGFVREDGTIRYYGPSISEYGQLLHTAALLEERGDPEDWWDTGFEALDRLAEHLLGLRHEAESGDGLILGCPEADIKKSGDGTYFHNNAWAVKGLRRWADLCERLAASPTTEIRVVRGTADALAADTLAAIGRTWPEDPNDWWLPPQTEPVQRPACLTATQTSSYTNYRYWPELLSSDLLPDEMANRVVDSRLSAGGQFCGMTRFATVLDDWPLADYLYGLWALGRKRDFLLSLYGHVAYHQAEGHLTAYESVTLPNRPQQRPFRENAAYCLPSQLVPVRAARLLL